MVIMINNMRPPRPTHPTFTDSLWELMRRCWDDNPQLRPEASEVLQILLTLSVPRLFQASSVCKLDYIFACSDFPAWKRSISDHLSVDERTSLITSVFLDPDQIEVVASLPKNDAQALADVIDKVTSHAVLCAGTGATPLNLTESFTCSNQALDNLTPGIQRRCLYYLSKICGRHNLLPESVLDPLRCDLAGTVQHRGKLAIVRKGWYNGQEIAAKALRDLGGDLEQTKKVGATYRVQQRNDHIPHRDFTRGLRYGRLSTIRTSCRCWGLRSLEISSQRYQSGWRMGMSMNLSRLTLTPIGWNLYVSPSVAYAFPMSMLDDRPVAFECH